MTDCWGSFTFSRKVQWLVACVGAYCVSAFRIVQLQLTLVLRQSSYQHCVVTGVTIVFTEHSATVVSAHWATVD